MFTKKQLGNWAWLLGFKTFRELLNGEQSNEQIPQGTGQSGDSLLYPLPGPEGECQRGGSTPGDTRDPYVFGLSHTACGRLVVQMSQGAGLRVLAISSPSAGRLVEKSHRYNLAGVLGQEPKARVCFR